MAQNGERQANENRTVGLPLLNNVDSNSNPPLDSKRFRATRERASTARNYQPLSGCSLARSSRGVKPLS